MRVLGLFFAVLGVFFMIASAAAQAERYHSHNYYGGRFFRLMEPTFNDKRGRLPLIIVLHGATGNADSMQASLRRNMRPQIERYGFMAAFLNGSSGKFFSDHRTWNAGLCCGSAGNRSKNDVGYIRGFIDHAVEYLNADPKRIYLMGYSNGAMMAYRYVCEFPKTVAAVVVLSGTLMADQCYPKGLKGVLHVHGGDDMVVPVEGGVSKVSIFRKEYYTSVSDVESFMKESGVHFRLKLIENVGHSYEQADAKINVPATAWRFLRKFRR